MVPRPLDGRRAGRGAVAGHPDVVLSRSAIQCLDHQLSETLDLAVTCRVLSDSARDGGDPLTAVALERLSTGLYDQAAVLASLVHAEPYPLVPLVSESPPPDGMEAWLAELDGRLSRAGVVAQTGAMSPGLEPTVAGLLSSLAALYSTSREFLLVSRVLASG